MFILKYNDITGTQIWNLILQHNNMTKEWEKIISKCLGKNYRKRTSEIMDNIKYVDLGLKYGYLLDFGISELTSLSDLLETLYKENHIGRHLTAVQIVSDYMVVSFKALLDTYSGNPYDVIKVVDISSSLSEPKVLHNECKELDAVISEFKSLSLDTTSHVFDGDGLNLTAVFGILIGYPVVYWFDSEEEKSANACAQSVQHVTVKGTDAAGISHVVYSFSFPDKLKDAIQDHVTKWFQSLKDSLKWSALFNSLEIHQEKVSLDSLVL